MATVGYRRVSTYDQDLGRQELDGCDRVFEEKESGAKRDRPQLQELLAYIRDGDRVVVHSIDRLARDLRDLQEIISRIVGVGAVVSFTSERLEFKPDGEDPFATLQLQMLGAFAEFERALTRRRQAEGIRRAKERGVYRGRKATIDVGKVRELREQGFGASEIAEQMGIGRASVYRVLKAG